MKHRSIAMGAFVLLALAATRLHSYLLFHSLAEVFGIVVAFAVFMLAWNARRFSTNNYILFLGIASLFIGGIDLLHALAFRGMGVFPKHDPIHVANLPTQLWIAARGLQAVSLLLAPLFLHRDLKVGRVFAGYVVVTAALLGSIFADVFPDCLLTPGGLTPFKVVSEYVICGILVAAGVLLLRSREEFDPAILRLLVFAIGATVVSELAFTLYVDVDGPINMTGHLLKIVAFTLIYVAIVETGFQKPYQLLFRDLKASEDALQASNRELEVANVEMEAANSELYEQSEELRTKQATLTEMTEELRFLSEASSILASSLDYETTLQRVAQLALPTLADTCIIDVVSADGPIRRVAVTHVDPELQPLADKLRKYPPDASMRHGVPEVIRSGRPMLIPEVPESALQEAAQDEAHLDLLRRFGPLSVIVVPLVAREHTLGALTLSLTRPGRRYAKDDLALAEELARRAAMAVDNALLYDQAQAANAAKDQFMAVLSHELRNPLTPILAGVELLRRSVPNEGRVGQMLSIVERNARLQARLVNDLLDLSRIARGKVHLQRAPLSLDSVVRAAVQDQQARADGPSPALHVDADPSLWVLGDYDRLQQVISNLLTNAVKFTPAEGEVRVSVSRVHGPQSTVHGPRSTVQGPQATVHGPRSTVSGEQSTVDHALSDPSDDGGPSGLARIVIEDTGLGIDRELLPHLFEIFRQGEVTGQRQAGLGIGLSLVKSLVEMHGGQVWAESEGPGKGSRFTIELPRVAGPDQAPGAGAQEQREGRIRVILVEDNPDTRAMLQETLDAMGYEVHATHSAEDALALLQHTQPDVILSDIGLPGLNGYEFMQQVRESPTGSRIPAFAVTGYGSAEDVSRAYGAGFLGHFVKPVDVAALDERIREWLAKSADPGANPDGC